MEAVLRRGDIISLVDDAFDKDCAWEWDLDRELAIFSGGTSVGD